MLGLWPCFANAAVAASFSRAPNGLEVNPRGQGPRGYGSAAHGLPACESRDAGRAPPFSF